MLSLEDLIELHAEYVRMRFDAEPETHMTSIGYVDLCCDGDVVHHGQIIANVEDDPEGEAYKIVRFFRERDKPSEVIEHGLTLEQAQEHCQRDDTRGDGWFDGYRREA